MSEWFALLHSFIPVTVWNCCHLQINVAYPATGSQKCFEIDDDLKLRHFYEKRMAQETEADSLGDEWKVSLS